MRFRIALLFVMLMTDGAPAAMAAPAPSAPPPARSSRPPARQPQQRPVREGATSAPARVEPAEARGPQLPRYESRYYVIHTDLTGDALREAELRMTRMAEEYHARTRGFSGAISRKFPFFLFKREADYHAAGGTRGSAGMFNPRDDTLMAIAGEEVDAYTWSVVQHEGFHQFARAVIGGQLPVWVNEGLAEYFGEGLFTGDGFVTGVVPPDRLARIKKQLRGRQFRPIRDMMMLRHADWNEELTQANYDQAWAMVQFLAHAEGGKYQDPFVSFMRAIGAGAPWEQAWTQSFGTADGFEQKWREYWLALDPEASMDAYVRATVQTVTSALARATAQRQRFASFDALATAAAENTLLSDDRDWLPPALVQDAFKAAAALRKRGATFALTPPVGTTPPTVVCTLSDGTKWTGRFKHANGRVTEVQATRVSR